MDKLHFHIYHIFFISSLVNGQITWFHNLVIVHSEAIIMHLQASLLYADLGSLVIDQLGVWLDHMVVLF